jgi:hypothetical protein
LPAGGAFFEEQLQWRRFCRKLIHPVETSVDNCGGGDGDSVGNGNGNGDNVLVHVFAVSYFLSILCHEVYTLSVLQEY